MYIWLRVLNIQVTPWFWWSDFITIMNANKGILTLRISVETTWFPPSIIQDMKWCPKESFCFYIGYQYALTMQTQHFIQIINVSHDPSRVMLWTAQHKYNCNKSMIILKTTLSMSFHAFINMNRADNTWQRVVFFYTLIKYTFAWLWHHTTPYVNGYIYTGRNLFHVCHVRQW